MSPEEFGRAQILRKEAQQRLKAENELQALDATRQEMERNQQEMDAAREQTGQELQRISTRSEELLKAEVDPGRWWANRSTGQKVASYVAAAIGGLLAPGRGGRNDAINMIMSAIDQDIDAQKASFTQQRAQFADARTMALRGLDIAQDAHEAAEAKRLASYGMLRQQLAGERAKYDPAGTTAQRIAEMERGIAAQEAQSRAALEQKAFDRHLAMSKEAREWAKVKPRGRGVGGGRIRRPEQATEYPPELREMAASGKEGRRRAEYMYQRMVVDPVTGKPTRRKDGTLVTTASPKVAESLNESGAMLSSVNDMVNQAVALRGRHGWEPTGEWWASDAGKRMASLSTELMLLNKDIYQLGVLSESDEKLLRKIQGGELAGLQDPRPALEDMRQRMISKYNQRRKSMAQGSQPLEFTITTTPPKRTKKDVDVMLNQGPDLRTGDVPSARERLAVADEKMDVLIDEEGGNIRAASERFTKEGQITAKKADAHLQQLREEWEDARPANWADIVEAQGRAIGRRLRLSQDPNATGEEINEADIAVSTSERAMERALSPRARRLRQSIDEQESYIEGLAKKIGGEARRQAEAKQVREDEKAAAEAARKAFEAAEVPSGGRPGL
jgi:hypothetical protein